VRCVRQPTGKEKGGERAKGGGPLQGSENYQERKNGKANQKRGGNASGGGGVIPGKWKAQALRDRSRVSDFCKPESGPNKGPSGGHGCLGGTETGESQPGDQGKKRVRSPLNSF